MICPGSTTATPSSRTVAVASAKRAGIRSNRSPGPSASGTWTAGAAVRACKPLAIGLNCSLGPDLMRPSIEALSSAADTFVSAYPNAGLPNPLAPTGFDLHPEDMEKQIDDFASSGFVNLVGGCCGNTPEHIAAIAEAAARHAPREVPSLAPLSAPQANAAA